MRAVGLVEGLADRGRDDGVLAARDVGEGVPHPVNAAALPGCFEHAGDGGLEAGVRVADHQPDPTKAPGTQGPQELGPEGLGFGRADAQADDLPAALDVRGNGDYRRDWHDAAALAHLEVSGVQPE